MGQTTCPPTGEFTGFQPSTTHPSAFQTTEIFHRIGPQEPTGRRSFSAMASARYAPTVFHPTAGHPAIDNVQVVSTRDISNPPFCLTSGNHENGPWAMGHVLYEDRRKIILTSNAPLTFIRKHETTKIHSNLFQWSIPSFCTDMFLTNLSTFSSGETHLLSIISPTMLISPWLVPGSRSRFA